MRHHCSMFSLGTGHRPVSCVFYYKRYTQAKAEKDWFSSGVDGDLRASMTPGYGPKARGEQLPDEHGPFQGSEKADAYFTNTDSPFEKKQAYPFTSSSFSPDSRNITVL